MAIRRRYMNRAGFHRAAATMQLAGSALAVREMLLFLASCSHNAAEESAPRSRVAHEAGRSADSRNRRRARYRCTHAAGERLSQTLMLKWI